MPLLGDRAARARSRARPASDSACGGGLRQSGPSATSTPTVPPMRRPPALAEAPWTCRRVGGSCGGARASHTGGRTGAIAKVYRVFIGTTRAEGAVQVGSGETVRKNKWGRDRKYVVAFLSGGSPQQPLVEFVAADDYEQTRELVAASSWQRWRATHVWRRRPPSSRLHRTLSNPASTSEWSTRAFGTRSWSWLARTTTR